MIFPWVASSQEESVDLINDLVNYPTPRPPRIQLPLPRSSRDAVEKAVPFNLIGSEGWIRTNDLRVVCSKPQIGQIGATGQDFEPLFDTPLGPIVHALAQLSPSSQNLVSSLVRQLAEREGINIATAEDPGLKTPAEGIPLWVAKLKAERYAERTIQTYLYHVRRYLGHDPMPTKLGIQSYLAKRLEHVRWSPKIGQVVKSGFCS